MLVKLKSKNRLTIPKAILSSCPNTEYFDVINKNGCIILTPVQFDCADSVRSKLDALGISGKDIGDAVSWARSKSKRTG